MVDINQVVLASLEESGQFTPEQRVAIAQAVEVGISQYILNRHEVFESLPRETPPVEE